MCEERTELLRVLLVVLVVSLLVVLDELGAIYTLHRLEHVKSVDFRHRKLAVDLLCRAAALTDCDKERALVQATLREPAVEKLVGQLVSQEDTPRIRALLEAGMDPLLQGAGSRIQGTQSAALRKP